MSSVKKLVFRFIFAVLRNMVSLFEALKRRMPTEPSFNLIVYEDIQTTQIEYIFPNGENNTYVSILTSLLEIYIL